MYFFLIFWFYHCFQSLVWIDRLEKTQKSLSPQTLFSPELLYQPSYPSGRERVNIGMVHGSIQSKTNAFSEMENRVKQVSGDIS